MYLWLTSGRLTTNEYNSLHIGLSLLLTVIQIGNVVWRIIETYSGQTNQNSRCPPLLLSFFFRGETENKSRPGGKRLESNNILTYASYTFEKLILRNRIFQLFFCWNQVKIWFQNRRMKWRNSKERELLASGGSRSQTLPTKSNPHPGKNWSKKINNFVSGWLFYF